MALSNVFNDNGGTASTSSAARQENISSQCNGSTTSFTTSTKFIVSTLKVYWNGMRQFKDVTITITNNQTFTTSFTPANNDYLFVDYQPI